jgi:hypothetical protein
MKNERGEFRSFVSILGKQLFQFEKKSFLAALCRFLGKPQDYRDKYIVVSK